MYSAALPPVATTKTTQLPSGLSFGSVRSRETMHRSTAIAIPRTVSALIRWTTPDRLWQPPAHRDRRRCRNECSDVRRTVRRCAAPLPCRILLGLTVVRARHSLPHTSGAPERAASSLLHRAPKETPMWSNHPYAAHHLSTERQERLRRISRRTRLLHDIRRDKRRQHMKT